MNDKNGVEWVDVNETYIYKDDGKDYSLDTGTCDNLKRKKVGKDG